MAEEQKGSFVGHVMTFPLPQFAHELAVYMGRGVPFEKLSPSWWQKEPLSRLTDPAFKTVKIYKPAAVGHTERMLSKLAQCWDFMAIPRRVSQTLDALIRRHRHAWWQRQEAIAVRHLRLIRGVLPYPWVPFTTAVKYRWPEPFVIWPEDLVSLSEQLKFPPVCPPLSRVDYLSRLKPEPADRAAFFEELERHSSGKNAARTTTTMTDGKHKKGTPSGH